MSLLFMLATFVVVARTTVLLSSRTRSGLAACLGVVILLVLRTSHIELRVINISFVMASLLVLLLAMHVLTIWLFLVLVSRCSVKCSLQTAYDDCAHETSGMCFEFSLLELLLTMATMALCLGAEIDSELLRVIWHDWTPIGLLTASVVVGAVLSVSAFLCTLARSPWLPWLSFTLAGVILPASAWFLIQVAQAEPSVALVTGSLLFAQLAANMFLAWLVSVLLRILGYRLIVARG